LNQFDLIFQNYRIQGVMHVVPMAGNLVEALRRGKDGYLRRFELHNRSKEGGI
jgi:hypothetical protein